MSAFSYPASPGVVVLKVDREGGAGNDELKASSARLLGLDGWDRFTPLAGGRGGANLAWKDGVAYVVKVYPSGDGVRGARERAALHALAGAAGTPCSWPSPMTHPAW